MMRLWPFLKSSGASRGSCMPAMAPAELRRITCKELNSGLNAASFSGTAGRRAELKRSDSFRFEAPRDLSTQSSQSETPREGDRPQRTVVITGAAGNLGGKAAQHLLQSKSAKYKLVLMDCVPCPETFKDNSTFEKNGHTIEYVECDFSKYERRWADKLSSAFAVFLFAARHPQPDAKSEDVFSSMMINSNLLEACAQAQTGRVVLASSNHVMGGMLHQEGKIKAGARPMIGTKYEIPGASMDSTLYASAKVAAEVQTKAMVDSGRLASAIITRIGFCQPGENRKESLPITGNPSKQPQMESPGGKHEERNKQQIMQWWKGMYLSNEDFGKVVDRCLEASDSGKRGAKQLMYVNGVSANHEGRWELEGNDIGFAP